MAWIKTALLCSAFLATTLSQAAQKPSMQDSPNSAKAAAHPPYGENPNIFKVFAYKTQEKVINTADKVGEVAENGIAKIKPKVGQAWDTVTAAPNGTVPIESKSLSQSSTAPVITTPQMPHINSSEPLSPHATSTIKLPTPSNYSTRSPSTSAQESTEFPSTLETRQPTPPTPLKAAADAVPASQPISNTEPEAEALPKLAPLKPAQAEAPASNETQSGVFYL